MTAPTTIITIHQSFYYNGLWQAANWSARVVDDATGEIVLSAELPSGDNNGPFAALRLTMADVAKLRTLAGFTTNPAPYDCRTTGERLAVQEDRLQILSDTMRRIVAEIDQRLTELEEAIQADIRERIADRQQLDALEKRAASHAIRIAQVPSAVKRINDLEQMLQAVKTLEATHATPPNP